MLNKLQSFLRQYAMLAPGDRVVCAVSGGADSMALLWAMMLLREKLGIQVAAAHFNHGLRGPESDRDEAFVRDFCAERGIPLHLGRGRVTAGPKGLEAAAREARYAFLETLPGKLATAHTADDNGETLLLRLVRGTGLKGLGGIAPVRGRILRPMLGITRQEVLAFLEEQGIPHVEDSSNDTDDYLRNRLRHRVMPLLAAENPRMGETLSALALRLREDEAVLSALADRAYTDRVEDLRGLPPALRRRVLARLLAEKGLGEPEAEHIALAEALVFSRRPSARGQFPGGVVLCRDYDRLEAPAAGEVPAPGVLTCPGITDLPEWGLRLTAVPSGELRREKDAFSVRPVGQMVIRSRRAGDALRLPGGTKSLKKLFIDRKIPAHRRPWVPVLADDRGVLGVVGLGVNLDRLEKGVTVTAETLAAEQ